ncbi:MAG: MazG nucleotide pyrophosphohydrolase domain-containing protein, partial [Catenibacillus sp.]|nr:MazG nucleotide pyrophosphohydrolase domain-containing protein [Catenibacillus sp.]
MTEQEMKDYVNRPQSRRFTFEEFKNIIAQLRAENGCPWDRKQTHDSLRDCMLEEAYEVVDAIDNHDTENLKEELGDILLQVYMHAQISSETGEFEVEDVVDGIARKMLHRHPHVFGQAKA